MIVKDTKISQNIKKQKLVEHRKKKKKKKKKKEKMSEMKMPYYNYRKLFLFRKFGFFLRDGLV